jgi:hypothetical protein
MILHVAIKKLSPAPRPRLPRFVFELVSTSGWGGRRLSNCNKSAHLPACQWVYGRTIHGYLGRINGQRFGCGREKRVLLAPSEYIARCQHEFDPWRRSLHFLATVPTRVCTFWHLALAPGTWHLGANGTSYRALCAMLPYP